LSSSGLERADAPDLSVVIATVDAERSIVRSIEAVQRACAGVSADWIVVDASTDRTADLVSARFPSVRLVRLPAGTLTPRLWMEGARHTTGRAVAFTTGHCVPGEGWALALLTAISRGATGAGGPLLLAAETSALDWAVFYLRYSAFIPERLHDGRIEGEIAGDNAAYRRDALDRYASVVADGFWEVDFHAAVRRDGGWIAATRQAVTYFGPSFPLATILRHRFAHGRHFGASRVSSGAASRWRIAAASPTVPALLAARAARRVLPVPEHRLRLLTALPGFVVLAGAWALGEVVGAFEAQAASAPSRRVAG
jgi:glycosyltransferase involved in cell wall biosynthesis